MDLEYDGSEIPLEVEFERRRPPERKGSVFNIGASSLEAIDTKPVDSVLRPYAEISFKPTRFLLELVYHTFHLIPLIILVDGWRGVINRSFFGTSYLVAQQTSMNLFIYLLTILYIVYGSPYITVYEVILIDTLWFVRNIVISIKYGYCTDAEMQDMARMILPPQVHTDRMILSGWVSISPSAVERQIKLASLRQGVDLETLKFRVLPGLTKADLQMYLPHVMEDSRDYGLYSHLVPDEDGTYTSLPVLAVISQLVLDGNRHRAANLFALAMFLAVIFSLLALITRATEHLSLMGGSQWYSYVITICMMLAIFFNMFTNFGYLFAGITDFSRRALLQKHLSLIITRGYEPMVSRRAAGGKEYFSEHGPLIFDLSLPENVGAWWASRQVLQDFGLSFYKRVNGYTGAFILFAVAMIVSLYYVVLTGQTLASFAVFVQVGYAFVILLVIISFLVLFGGKANQARREQALIFLRKKTLLETLTLDSIATDEIKQQLRLSIDLLSSVAQLIDIDNQEQKITILGFEAGGQFARSLVALAIAGVGVFLRTFV